MFSMIFIILLADVLVAKATSDDGAAAEAVIDNQQGDENRTNINDPGTAQTGEDLQKLNIANNQKGNIFCIKKYQSSWKKLNNILNGNFKST